MTHRRSAMCIGLLWLLAVAPAFAIMQEISLDQLAQGADLIVKGKVVATEARWVEDQRGKHIYTYVTVLPDTRLKGAPPNDALKIEVRGGTVGDEEEWVEDSPAFARGEEAVLFLAGSPLNVFGNFQGKYLVLNGNVYLKDRLVDVDTFLKTVEKAVAKTSAAFAPAQTAVPTAASKETMLRTSPTDIATSLQGALSPAVAVAPPRSSTTSSLQAVDLPQTGAANPNPAPVAARAKTEKPSVEFPPPSGHERNPRKLSVGCYSSSSNLVDKDNDGYWASVTYTRWLAGEASDPNYEDVWFKTYIKPASGSSWELVLDYPKTRFGVNTYSYGPNRSFTISNRAAGLYYMKTDWYRSYNGEPVIYSPGSPTPFTYFETSADDLRHPRPEIKSVFWTNKVDTEGDTYGRSARLAWNVGLASSDQGSIVVYERIYWMRAGSGSWAFYKETPRFTVSATTPRYLEIATPGPRDNYMFRVDLYRIGRVGDVHIVQQSNSPWVTLEPAFEDRFMAALWDPDWTTWEDYDGDGFKRTARLTWVAQIAGGLAGPANVFEKVYRKKTGAASWTLTTTTKQYQMYGAGKLYTSHLDIQGQTKGIYDFKVEIYGQGQTKPDDKKDPVTTPEIKGYPMETVQEDPPRAEFYDYSCDSRVDKDRDGYARSVRLYWRLQLGGPGFMDVYEKIFYRPYGSGTAWTLLKQLPSHKISRAVSGELSFTVTGLNHARYDFLIRVYRVSATQHDTEASPSSSGIWMETAYEDGAPVISTISPSSASAGTGAQVTITGQRFGTSGIVAFFYQSGKGKLAAPIVSWADTRIVCKVPTAAGSGKVEVRTAADVSDGYNFRVTFGYTGTGFYWSGSAPTVSFLINPNTTDCSGASLEVRRAMTTWNAAGSKIFYQNTGSTAQTAPSKNGSNEIMWTSTLGTTTIAQANIWKSWGTIAECDIAFNDPNFLWNTNSTVPSNRMDVQTIAVHELGHAGGLSDLYGDYGDGVYDRSKVMYGFFWNGLSRRVLHADDRAGLMWLYNGGPASTLPGGGLLDLAYGPPLTITSCDFTPAAPMAVKPGEKISLGALIENDGAKKTPWVWLECWVSKSGDPMKLDGLLIETDLIPPLEPGKGRSYVATKSVLDLPPGEYTVVFVAHPAGAKDAVSPSDSRVAVPGKRIVIGSK